jgi:hypothetical protein
VNVKTDFNITIPLQKSDREDGWYVTGIAAGTDVDSEDWKLTENCITKFVQQVGERQVPFKDWHAKNTIMSEMGTVEKAWITPNFEMGVEVALDQDHPGAQWLWKQLSKGKQYGMSVAGDVPESGYRIEKSGTGKRIVVIDEAELEEISCTTKPIYTPSFGTMLRKAIDEAEAKSVPTGDKSSVDETPVTTDEQTTETTAVVAATPAEAQEQPVTSVQKAVSTDTVRDAKGLAKLVKQYHEMGTLLVDLGIDVSAPATEEAPSTDTTVVEKSTDESTDDSELLALVKSVVETNSALKAEIESLKERIPEVTAPGVTIRKSEAEEAFEAWGNLRRDNPKEALRLALEASHASARR